jgi:hypothetical protein
MPEAYLLRRLQLQRAREEEGSRLIQNTKETCKLVFWSANKRMGTFGTMEPTFYANKKWELARL